MTTRKTNKKTLKKTKKEFLDRIEINGILFQIHSYHSELEEEGVKKNIPYGQYLITRNGKDLCFSKDRLFIYQKFMELIEDEKFKGNNQKAFIKTRKKWKKLEKIQQWDVLVKKMKAN